MMLIRIFLINLIFLTSIYAAPLLAGKEGHGGYGVLIDNKPYLLDLVEAGVEKKPFFDHSFKVNHLLKNDLSLSLYSLELTNEEMNLLIRKLSEIEAASPILAFTYFAAIKLYNWKLINVDLVNSPDLSSVIHVNDQDLIQLANRKEQYIRINGKYWRQLDAANKIALIFHEMSYAFISADGLGNDPSPEDLVAQSAKARDITGYLFSIDFKIRGVRGFRIINNSTIPFDFSEEKVNIFNHSWVHNADGFVLKRGILKVSISRLDEAENEKQDEEFIIDLSNDNTSATELVRKKVKNYCSQINQLADLPALTIQIKTDSLKDVIIKFAKGQSDSHLLIEENKPEPETKTVYGYQLRNNSCERVLLKEIYLRNRFYTPIDNFSTLEE